jgi:hypothetical protein
VLFAGDTAYTDAFSRIIMPRRSRHGGCSGEVGADYLLPVHHSTFRLSREPVGEPIERLLAAAGPEGWRVVAPEAGATWALP